MRRLLVAFLLLAACSKGPEADLPSISEARSLGAEWALANEAAAKGHVTNLYAETMRKQLRQQLETDLGSLTQPQSRYGDEVRALLALPDDAPPEVLRAHARALKEVEDKLESA
jgi:hypothetical protein